MQSYNARLGLVLFFVYLAMYAGFVFLNAFSPESMEITPFAGLNLAILYGFGLIIAALLLALLYGFMCREEEPPADSSAPKPTPPQTPAAAAKAGDKA